MKTYVVRGTLDTGYTYIPKVVVLMADNVQQAKEKAHKLTEKCNDFHLNITSAFPLQFDEYVVANI